MKHDILGRYDRDPGGRVIIGVRSDSCNALFNAYDFVSSLVKRDLKTDLAEYLIESVEEIGRSQEFVIRVSLPEAETRATSTQRIGEAVRGYFGYRISVDRNLLRTILVRTLIKVFLALGLLVLLVVLERGGGRSDSLWGRIFFEGLYIAVWVLMWPLFSDFLFDLRSTLSRIRLYRRIMAAELQVCSDVT
jgi:hypothetical protein